MFAENTSLEAILGKQDVAEVEYVVVDFKKMMKENRKQSFNQIDQTSKK